MINVQQKTKQSLLAIHGWSAVFLGLLLYWVIFTGTVAVFGDELNDWASPLPQAVPDSFPVGTDAMLKKAASEIDPKYLDEMIAFETSGGRMRAFFHTHGEPEEGGHPVEEGVLYVFDPNSGEVLQTAEGTQEEIESKLNFGKLGQFFIEWHVRLHVPSPWGLILTGILGLTLLASCITGFVVHKHLIKEAFLRRKRGKDLLTAKDTHVMASTWNLPFAFILAFTGSFYSLAGAFAIPAIAMVAFGGDQEKLIETVQGVPAAENPTPATMADFDAMLESVRAEGATPRFITVNHWGREDAVVNIFPWQADGEVLPKGYDFDPHTGENLGVRPTLGQAPSLGGDLVALMGPLHFGDFAGWLSKIVWFALGFAGAYATVTGLTLWVRRREENKRWQHLLRATVWSAWGLPIAMVMAAHAYLVHQGVHSSTLVEPLMFKAFGLTLLVAAILAWAVRDIDRLQRLFVGLTGLSLLALPIVRIWQGGYGWVTAFNNALSAVWALDVAFVVSAFVLLRIAVRSSANEAVEGSNDSKSESKADLIAEEVGA